ncbi:MAG: F0F1 ATP synthase subunit delta, partial [Deltaproteobacteria bacterium]|nr:F0F1 ATP synthase subunit delta [Deltaproteobacteria bacterium]
MRSSAAARRYARALFLLAKDDGRIAEVKGELAQFSAVIEQNENLRQALFQPIHPAAERRAVLVGVCERMDVQPTVRNLFSFLVDQRRLVDFEGIREEYERLADEAAGRTKASVISAAPLSDGDRERLERALSARTGGIVELDIDVDPSLIGGVIAKVGALVFDGSLRTQLNQLRA